MIRKKDLDNINARLDAISGSVMDKASKYSRQQELLKQFNIRVDKAYACFDERSLRFAVKIELKVPTITLYIDDDGESEFNPRFSAINELRLIPIEDLDIVAAAIEKAKKENAQGGNE